VELLELNLFDLVNNMSVTVYDIFIALAKFEKHLKINSCLFGY